MRLEISKRAAAETRRAARYRLRRYRRYYGDAALLIVPFPCLSRSEQFAATSVATLSGARLAVDWGTTPTPWDREMPGSGLLRLVIEPLARLAVEWDFRAAEAIDERDLDAWRRLLGPRDTCTDVRAMAFCRGWAGLRLRGFGE